MKEQRKRGKTTCCDYKACCYLWQSEARQTGQQMAARSTCINLKWDELAASLCRGLSVQTQGFADCYSLSLRYKPSSNRRSGFKHSPESRRSLLLWAFLPKIQSLPVTTPHPHSLPAVLYICICDVPLLRAAHLSSWSSQNLTRGIFSFGEQRWSSGTTSSNL